MSALAKTQWGGARSRAGRHGGDNYSPAPWRKHAGLQELEKRHTDFLDDIRGSNLDPLITLLKIAANEELPTGHRVAAATSAVRYIYPTLSENKTSIQQQPPNPDQVLQDVRTRLARVHEMIKGAESRTIDAKPEPVK